MVMSFQVNYRLGIHIEISSPPPSPFSLSPHSLSHTASLFLIYMETLIGHIEDFIKNEKRKQVWVPVVKNES